MSSLSDCTTYTYIPSCLPFFSNQDRAQSYAHYIRYNEHRKMLTKKTTGMGGAAAGRLAPQLRFGLFTRIHAISHLGASPLTLFDW